MATRTLSVRAGIVLLLGVAALALILWQPAPTTTNAYASQGELPTFVDRPADAAETYPGSSIYKRAAISPEIEAAVGAQSQEDWEKYHITKESNLGLPLGSVFLRAANGKYVELALYERAAFTVFKGKPARQILAGIIFEGKVQVTEDESIAVPSYLRSVFADLPVAGEASQSTPLVGAIAKLLSTDRAKAADANWSKADQLFRWNGGFEALDGSLKVEPLALGQPDATTGHRVPDVIGSGLGKMFGEKIVENAGLPLSPAVWILAQVKGAPQAVCVQVFQRAIVTYNPANDEANRVQVGLGGGTIYLGLSTDDPPPTAAPVPPPSPTATPASGEGPEDYQTTFRDKNGQEHKFVYDNAPSSEQLPRLALTLATDEDKSDYAELLKRTGRTSDFAFIVAGYYEGTGEPPSGWQGGSFNGHYGVSFRFICRFDQNRNVIIKYRDRNFYEQILNDTRLARIYGTYLGGLAIRAVLSQDDNVGARNSVLANAVGADPLGQRIWHKLGLNANGYPTNFAEKAWPSFWSLQKP